MRDFDAAAEWSTVEVPWSELGLDGRGIMAIIISASPPAGTFSLLLDDVRLF
jgi:hypothetical protein